MLRFVPVLLMTFLASEASRAEDHAIRVCVRDEQGVAVADAQVLVHGHPLRQALTDNEGCARVLVTNPANQLEVSHAGFASAKQAAGASDVNLVLRIAATNSVVDVTAQRTPLALEANASSIRTMTGEQYREAPGFNLDDKLRQVAGFQLFRRTGSWVANPTTQGTSLHGLASTAASRTLVLSDQIPLNDPFGGWVHWNEIPQLAIRSVELMRGGASDLYGSSAIGGVIDVLPVAPEERFSYALDLAGATQNTSSLNGLLSGEAAGWSGLAATSLFRTDGYILLAPEVRGRVDIPSNVHSQSGRIEVHHDLGPGAVFLRGNLLNEARSNGTPVTTNGTRLWRYAGGGDWSDGGDGRFLLRLHGANQSYRQSFSSVTADRASERLTRLQLVPSAQLGAVGQWAHTYGKFTAVVGSDVLDTRATNKETPYAASGAVLTPTITSARQRDTGVYGELLWQPEKWSVAFSSRVDRFSTFDAHQNTAVSLPQVGETLFNPRLGVVRQLGRGLSLSASTFRAFRGPSMNELYRTGQVGQQITLANPSLRSERATGWEAGGLMNIRRIGSIRASYFWTQVNRPIAAVQVSSTPTSQTLMRQNLGQLLSKGILAEFDMHPVSFLTVTAGYQYANSTVSKFQADPTLAGKWTAQVPRNSATLQARLEKRQWGTLAVDLRTSGQQFDDTANLYRLAPYALVDLYGEHRFGRRVTLWMSVQNLADARVEAGRTPQLTLASPRIVMGGIRLR